MNKKTRKILTILLAFILSFPLTGLANSDLAVFAAGNQSKNSSANTVTSYSVSKSKVKKVSKKTKKAAKPTAVPTATPTPTPVPGSESIADAYKNYFELGVATPSTLLNNSLTRNLILKQFHTITMENEMKPDYLLDGNKCQADPAKYNTCPAVNLTGMEKYLKFAQDNNLKVRFHTLVWHAQTSRWFFAENYSKDENAPLVSREIMLQRMENYIRQVMECAKKYPGVIYAWDVVNEAIEPGDKEPNGLRTNISNWYKTIGPDLIEKAFTYARKYSYDKAGLFYNDFGEYDPGKLDYIFNMLKGLKEKGLVDGIGMQSHIGMSYPSIRQYETAVLKYASIGLEINVSELDIGNEKNTDSAFQYQAARYKALFEMLLKHKKDGSANITHVTIWGLRDSDSWLRKPNVPNYPLLFDAAGKPKPCYIALMDLIKQY